MKNETEYILEFKHLTKKYPGVIALNDINFKVPRNKILSLVGENGAGKSTLLKCISGVISSNKYDGDILFEGVKTHFTNIKSSQSLGIAIIHQELSISPNLSLYENIFIGHYESSWGVTKWNKMILKAKELLELVGLKEPVNKKAGEMSVANQQLLEIAKALSKNAKLLILDEPTSSLNDKDSFKLLDLMKKLRDEQQITCIFVSHKLNEVEYVADAITVIRDGRHISNYDKNKNKITQERLIKDIVGRELGGKFPSKNKNRKIGEIVFEVKNFSVEDDKTRNKMSVIDASFNVRKGEIVGLSGLVGSGRSELALSIFGKSYGIRKSGEIFINGKKIKINNPKQAIRQKLMYATEDRKNTGLIQKFSIHNNISSAALHLFSFKGILRKNKEIINSKNKKERLGIKVPSIEYKVDTLSGGNQQKVVIAKALTTKFNTLIIDEPTKGIDVGSKYEIYKILLQLANEGKSIVVISSELEELLGITDRIFVMSQGLIKGEIETKNATPEKIMKISIGRENNE